MYSKKNKETKYSSSEENEKLRGLVKKYGESSWTFIAEMMNKNKPEGAKKPKSHYKKIWENYLNPDFNAEAWSTEENELLSKLADKNNINGSGLGNIVNLFNKEMKNRNGSYKSRTKIQIKSQIKKNDFFGIYKEFKNKKTTDLCLSSRIEGIFLGNIGKTKKLSSKTLSKIKGTILGTAEIHGVNACEIRVKDPNEEEKQLIEELKDEYNLSFAAIDSLLYRIDGDSEKYYNKKTDKSNHNVLVQGKQNQKNTIAESGDGSSLNMIPSVQHSYITANSTVPNNLFQTQQNQTVSTAESSGNLLNIVPQLQSGHITANNTVPNNLGCFFICPIQQPIPLQQVLPINPQFGVLQNNQNPMNVLYSNLSMANNGFGFGDKSLEQ